ncbi:hypothetical protein C7M61_000246 [Candidozyma pseudohaemuli]|uniref:CTLH domain-containing protein n=1 Tax=Candidozyma pseudohaemuli TaxID=418784 RepID=A0A2P7YXA4_9ASCO|nr:hypothetical protein C7M61_000246 [[Candida] pseudohaemulonii]PSK40598.1 hypothetical protein C7M61_000246 [[Candida] pseudohaemulonii]
MTGFNFQEHEDILHTSLEPSQRLYTHDQIPRQKINKLILNYFIQEGFPNAALSFSKEAQIDLKQDEESWVQLEKETKKFLTTPKVSSQDFIDAVNNYLNSLTTGAPREDHAIEETARDTIKGFSSIEKRKEIKYLVLKGDITKAIAAISTHFPSVLDSNNLLLFKLLRLNLIEMIRAHKLQMSHLMNEDAAAERKFLDDILKFVRKNLISKVTQSYDLLKELEMTMSLLCFNFDPKKPVQELSDLPDELKQLFDLSLRADCYRVVNRVILDLENSEQDSIQFKRQETVNFSADLLARAGPPPTLKLKEDVDMEDSSETTDIEDLIPKDFTDKEPVLAPSVDKTAEEQPNLLDSRLETIAKLWVMTERVLVEKKIIPHRELKGEKRWL